MAGSPLENKRDGDWSSVYSPENGEVYISSKKGEVGKTVEVSYGEILGFK